MVQGGGAVSYQRGTPVRRSLSLEGQTCNIAWVQQVYLTESVYNVVLQNTIPAQMRQLVL